MDFIQAVEYFSLIPDPLILIIINFLPFRDAVRTSVLSRRWRSLWHCTRSIDLDEKFFLSGNSCFTEIGRLNMMSFIQRWMVIYKEPQVASFRIAISDPPGIFLPLLQQCTRFAVDGGRRVEAVELDFSDPNWDEDSLDVIPRCRHPPQVTLDSRTMPETLGLSACVLRILESNTLFGIKNLFLGWMEMPGHSLTSFVSLCPFLETLILKRCWNLGNLEMNSESLRVLILDKCIGVGSVTVNAPVLGFFKYCGQLSVHLQMENVPRMAEAVFDLGLQPLQWDEESHPGMVFDLLAQIWSLRALTVCSYILQVLPKVGNLLMLRPGFASITHLCLRTQLHIQEYYGITFLLNCCPKLELISIDLGPKKILQDYRSPYRVEDHPFLSGLWHPGCLEKTLKTVKVKGFKGTSNEMMVLRYILKFSKVMENLLIQVCKEDGEEMEQIYRQNIKRLLQYEVISSLLKVYVR